MKEIKLTQGKVALVDDADFEWLNKFRWCIWKCGSKVYAGRKENHKTLYMHRLIMGIGESKLDIDHRDGNGLHNTKDNLRIATRSQNLRNSSSRKNATSQYLGVSWTNKNKYSKWRVVMFVNGKQNHVGCFLTEEEAARAYDRAAKIVYGEFANLNFKTG